MRNIKCAYTVCKFNSVKAIKNENGTIDHAEDLGDCNFEGDIILGIYECEECGNSDSGLDCKNFQSKFL